MFAVANADWNANSEDRAAHPGEVLHIYATGQGVVSPAVDDGVAAPAQPLSRSIATPNVFLLSRQLEVLYNGLAPGLAGVWQLDVMLPADAPTGPNLPLRVALGSTEHSLPVTVAR